MPLYHCLAATESRAALKKASTHAFLEESALLLARPCAAALDVLLRQTEACDTMPLLALRQWLTARCGAQLTW